MPISSHPMCSQRKRLFLYDHIEIIPVEAKTQISIYIKKNKFNLEIFQCFHQVPCVGYGVSEVRKKLKEEYTKLSGREIGEQWEKITQYKNIMIECTFIKEEDLEQADKTFHIHWRNLEPIVDKYKENNFILIHFSQRYENSWLTEFLRKKKRRMFIRG